MKATYIKRATNAVVYITTLTVSLVRDVMETASISYMTANNLDRFVYMLVVNRE